MRRLVTKINRVVASGATPIGFRGPGWWSRRFDPCLLSTRGRRWGRDLCGARSVLRDRSKRWMLADEGRSLGCDCFCRLCRFRSGDWLWRIGGSPQPRLFPDMREGNRHRPLLSLLCSHFIHRVRLKDALVVLLPRVSQRNGNVPRKVALVLQSCLFSGLSRRSTLVELATTRTCLGNVEMAR